MAPSETVNLCLPSRRRPIQKTGYRVERVECCFLRSVLTAANNETVFCHGVERTGVRIYRVKSTSGEEYGVVLAERAVCTCPATVMCSHIAAAEIARAKRRTA